MQNDACLNRDEASMLDYVRKRRDFPRLAKFSVCPPVRCSIVWFDMEKKEERHEGEKEREKGSCLIRLVKEVVRILEETYVFIFEK